MTMEAYRQPTAETQNVPDVLIIDDIPHRYYGPTGPTADMSARSHQRLIANNAHVVYSTLHFNNLGRIIPLEQTYRKAQDSFYLGPQVTEEDIERIFDILATTVPDAFGDDVRMEFSGNSATTSVLDAVYAAGIALPIERTEN